MSRTRFAAAIVFASAVALAAVATPANAVSVGFYGTIGTGSASGDADADIGGGSRGWDSDTTHTGAGLALESPTGIYRLSYRLGVGWERIEADAHGGADSSLEGLVLDNDFTYDLFASPVSRFWVGPEFRLGFLHGSLAGSPGGDRSFYAAGIGPVVGFDLALGPSAALSWKLGYLYTWYYTDDHSDWNGGGHHDDYYYDYDSQMDEGHAFLSMAVLFRTGGYGAPAAGPPPGTYGPGGRW